MIATVFVLANFRNSYRNTRVEKTKETFLKRERESLRERKVSVKIDFTIPL